MYVNTHVIHFPHTATESSLMLNHTALSYMCLDSSADFQLHRNTFVMLVSVIRTTARLRQNKSLRQLW